MLFHGIFCFMIRHEVTTLEPGIQNISDPKEGWRQQFAADVYIQPPVRIGAELGALIAGAAGNIIISEVTSTTEGTHATVACAESGDANARVVEQAIDRLRTYLNTDPLQAGLLREEFAREPLSVEIHHNFRQMM